MNFSEALIHVNTGKKIARSGWNGKNMWVAKISNWSGNVGGNMPEDWNGNLPFLAMYTADKHLVPWLASQTDILADDWEYDYFD